jgi:non-specific serine/threonine protein kinase
LYDRYGTVHWIDDKKNPKIFWLDGFIEEYLDDIGKLVISCKFIPPIKKLAARYEKYGATYVCGEVPAEERMKRMEKFQKDDACKIFILNAKTAEGMDLNPCQFMVSYTKDFQPKVNWQCEDRITGFNQVAEATIMPLLCLDSIDIKLEQVLEKKQVWFDAVMGDEGKTTPEVIEGGLNMTKEDLFFMAGV